MLASVEKAEMDSQELVCNGPCELECQRGIGRSLGLSV